MLNAIANSTSDVLYRSMNAVAVLPITVVMMTRQAGQPPSAPNPPRKPLNRLPLEAAIGVVLISLISRLK